ncbi:unnamed protein product [Mytilus edulis]|uniref:Uncharacterized protein n=1 Tax=Mytilus edulis TaxID=6550 RepID=A0A8S3SZ86_MYTED|nr:unnamed protein product [Mytilus edulis]
MEMQARKTLLRNRGVNFEREPRKNYIEFLINGSTVDGISYNKTMNKCSHRDGECKYNACACHRAGTEFIRIFTVTSVYGTQFSCDMRFNDKDKESIFSMERSLYINDTVFYNASTIKLIKPPARGNNKKIKTEHTGSAKSEINEDQTKLLHGKSAEQSTNSETKEKSDDKTVDNIYIRQNTMNDSKPYNEVGETEPSKYISYAKVIKTNLDEQHAEPQEAEDVSESTTQHTDTDFNLEEETLHDKTVDNIYRENETTISKRHISSRAEEICNQNTDIESTLSKNIRQNTMNDSIPCNEPCGTTTSEYISYAKVIKTNLDEQHAEPQEAEDVSESTTQHTDTDFNLEEDLVVTCHNLNATLPASTNAPNQATSDSQNDRHTQPDADERKHDRSNYNLEGRTKSLEKKLMKNLLGRLIRKYSKLDISSLCLSVLDEESVDTITKTISKCLKENLKQSDNTVDGNTVGGGDGAPTRGGSPSGCVSPTFQTPHRMSYQPNHLSPDYPCKQTQETVC